MIPTLQANEWLGGPARPSSAMSVAIGTRAVAACPLRVAITSTWYLGSSIRPSAVAGTVLFAVWSGSRAYRWLLTGTILSGIPSPPRCRDDPKHPASAVAPEGGVRYRPTSC